MSPPNYVRSTSHNSRRALPVHARSSKPAALKKLSPTAQGGKSGPGGSKTIGKKDAVVDTEDDDMAGLPQYCTSCEKQIITPGNSILYCSEICRRRDSNKPLSSASIPDLSSPGPSPHRNSYFELESTPHILPLRSPTIVRPTSLAFSDTSDTYLYDARPLSRRSENEPGRHYTQFGSPDYHNRRPNDEPSRASRSYSNAPSLSHTPGSPTSPSTSYFSSRPLPSRTNPYGASFTSRSIDLVTPMMSIQPLTAPSSLNNENASLRSSTSTATAYRAVEGEMTYEKKQYEASPSTGSLKQLFLHDAMKAKPRQLKKTVAS